MQKKPPRLVRLKSKLGSIALLIVAGILFPLLIIELAAWIKPDLIPPEIKSSIFQVEPPFKAMVPDRELGYKFAPDLADFPVSLENNSFTYTISTVSLGYDEIGFRDDGVEGDPYAVVIGDSFANCAGVELDACWVELFESETNKDFVNLSVLGYTPQQEYRMLVEYGLPLEPELVLWVFYANDVKDAWRFHYFGSGAARAGEFWESPLKSWLAQHSAVYTTLSFFWYNRYFFSQLGRAGGAGAPNSPEEIWWLANTDLTIPELVEGFALTQATILAANKQTTANGSNSKFMVVILPFREQVYGDPKLHPRFDSLNETLMDFLRQNEIAAVDLTTALREKAKRESAPLYFSQDIHLNERGNRIVAELLQQQLESVIAP